MMKALKPILALVAILAISTLSANLYLSQHYVSSALLTIVWVVGATHWISANGVRFNRAK